MIERDWVAGLRTRRPDLRASLSGQAFGKAHGVSAKIAQHTTYYPPPTHLVTSRNHFLWFGHLGGSIMEAFCLARRLFLLFHLFIFSRHVPTKQGGIPTKQGCARPKQGVHFAKQANFRPYFARTGMRQHEKSSFFVHKTPVLRRFRCFLTLALIYCGLAGSIGL